MPAGHAARPLLWLSAALACGCALGGASPPAAGWALLALAGLGLALAWCARGSGSLWALTAAAFAIGAAAAVAEATSWESTALRRWALTSPGTPALLEGTLAEDVRDRGDHRELVLDVEEARVAGAWRALTGRARVRVYGTPPGGTLIAGRRVRVWGRLDAPRGFRSEGGWNAEAYARRRGIHALGVCKSGLLVCPEPTPAGSWSARARQWSREQLEQHVPPGAERGLVAAMVLGDRAGVSEETSTGFRIAGTYHVLALSGAQVALIAALLLLGARSLELPRGVATAVVCGVLAAYASFVGGEIPVVRAVVMAGILVAGRGLDLEADLLNLLGLAGGLLLLFRPSWVGDVGFQLSFGATAAILVLGPALSARIRRLPLRLDLALAASLAAQAALVPLLLAHFQRLAPAAPLTNLVAAPLASAVLLSGFAVLLAAPLLGPLASALGALSWSLAHALLRSGALIPEGGLLDLRLPPPHALAAAAWLVGLFGLVDERRRGRALPLALAGGLALLAGPAPGPADGRLHLTVLDVGQGDALVLQSPAGRVAVVDAGGGPRFDLGESVVAPFLRARGVRRLDFLLVTHPHSDHVGGAPALLRDFRVRELWEGPEPEGGGVEARLGGAAAHVRRLGVVRGVRRAWDGVVVEVRGPRGGAPRGWSPNDASVVLALSYGEVRFLLAGDVEATGEAELAASAAEVLKVPHHGSATSSSAAFLDRVHPGVAVISCGRRNRFGHPHAVVVERLRRRGVRLLRTDRDGSVSLATDGRRVWLSALSGARESWVPRGAR